jgi:hypothetical protein
LGGVLLHGGGSIFFFLPELFCQKLLVFHGSDTAQLARGSIAKVFLFGTRLSPFPY